jgi:hypothetical protein
MVLCASVLYSRPSRVHVVDNAPLEPQDSRNCTAYMVYMLQNLHGIMSAVEQRSLADHLASTTLTTASLSSHMASSSSMQQLPTVLSLTPMRLGEQYVPVQRKSQQPVVDTGEFKFIYSPFQAKNQSKKEEPVVWVQQQLVEVTVVLSNALSFPIPIESIHLRCAHGDCHHTSPRYCMATAFLPLLTTDKCAFR